VANLVEEPAEKPLVLGAAVEAMELMAEVPVGGVQDAQEALLGGPDAYPIDRAGNPSLRQTQRRRAGPGDRH
jgi:hypothetical protein